MEKCRVAIAADETIEVLVEKLAHRKDKGEYSPDREPLARAISKHYKQGRSWRNWTVAAGAMIKEHRSALEETKTKATPPPEQDIAMRESIRRYVFDNTDQQHHGLMRHLWERWEEWNQEFFGGQMTVAVLQITTPSNPRRLGDCGPESG